MNMLDAVARLKDVGISSEQAEEIVRLQHEFMESRLTTKDDLELAKLELKKDIELVRAELKKDIELVRAELKKYVSDQGWKTIRWTVGLLALFVTILKYVLQGVG